MLVIRRVLGNKLAVFGFVVILFLILSSIVIPILSEQQRDAINLLNANKAPSSEHLLGTDALGRDVFIRLVHGTRVSLSVGLIATSISLVIGVSFGAIAGFRGGVFDIAMMRLVDIFMCFPFFVIAISVAAVLGASLWNVMIITGVLGWTGIARMVRAEVMSLREREFIDASRTLGLSSVEIIVKHLIPNILGILIVYATLGIAGGILAEAGLSFLGLGVKDPQPSWGNMLSVAQNLKTLKNHWWLWVPPGILIFITVLSINFLGDGLRDAFDPRLNK